MRSQRAVWSGLLVFAASLGLLSCGGNARPEPEGARTAHSRLATPAAWYATSAMPVARAQHAAVLLPDGRLLVINGVNRNGFVSTAETYDPATGTWSPAGTPGIQGNVSLAVLLPSGKVLMLTDGSQAGRVYDPATNAWTATGNMSATRGLPTATLLSSGQVLIAGGTGAGGVRLTTAELYDPGSNAFTATGPMAVGRNAHTATRLRDGRVLAVSGFNQAGEVPGADLYTPATGTWTVAAAPIVPRHYSTSTLLPDGRVLVAGGFTAGGVTTQSELYDPVANTWTATGSLAFPRSGHAANLLPDGRVLVTGGSDSSRAVQIESELYDPATGTWTSAGTMNLGRENHTATLLPTGKVFVAGGYFSTPSLTFYAETEVYDPAASRWSPAGSMGTPRTDPLVALLPTGRVLVAGGRGAGSSATVEVYDRASNSWSAAPALAVPRERATATVLRSGQVLVAGGRNGTTSTASTERYDSTTGTWLATAALPTPRHVHTATLLPDGRVLVAGGQTNAAVLVSAALYSPDTNTWSAAAPSGLARASHGAVLLHDGRVLVAGGHDSGGAETASAELYDPATDTWAPAANLAEARDELTLTLLPSGQVLATGGLAGFTPLTSTELYDPATNTWTLVGPLAQSRQRHTATLLPSGKVLVAGGLTVGSAFADTAEIYDPQLRAWTTVADPTTQGGLISTALPSGEVLLVGGVAATNAELFNDTGALPAWKPTVTNPATLVAGCPTVLEGLLFRGISGGSSGSYSDSPTDFPLVRLRAAEGGRLWTLPSSDTSATRATVTVPTGTPLGTYGLSVFANAIPGGRTVTLVANRPPTAADQAVTVPKDTEVELSLGGTDPDPGQALSWSAVTQPQHGTLGTSAQGHLAYTPAPGFVGTDSFTFRVRDCADDSNIATVTLTVVDGPPPTLTCPANVTAEATGADGAIVTYDPAVVVPAGLPVSYSNSSGSRFPLGDTTVTATSTGLTCTFLVTVRDTTAPTLTCPADRTVAPGETVTFDPTATDAVTASPPVTSSPASGSTFAPGATRVTVTATDDAGNTAQCTFQVRVQAEVVELAGGGCDSTGGTTSALALLAALTAWNTSRRRQNPARGN
ncbi:Kelch repeat-containing protein [Corallococcus carmarthensis]|uniref:HYR domain-containing protein n=1 Tax=Corallococcus carmarthensis TaxID=2316728 RepID=A0A3A8K9U1_9BACT|nr:kelch repeat-containing protein [Corallococcus carmarthensis]RKH04276.1 HYR domain-containing protein [Corallococcus carmarthensis]